MGGTLSTTRNIDYGKPVMQKASVVAAGASSIGMGACILPTVVQNRNPADILPIAISFIIAGISLVAKFPIHVAL